MMQLKQGLLDKIIAVRPILQKVETATQVPWEAVAAVWYRENSCDLNPPVTLGGQFQFDPPPSPAVFKAHLDKYSNLDERTKQSLVEMGINNFEAAAMLCGCWLQEKTGHTLTPNAPDHTVKDAFWGYNGRAFGAAENSSYVMNGFDDAHMRMKIRGTIPDGHGGREKTSFVDTRLGAFTVYFQLKQLKS